VFDFTENANWFDGFIPNFETHLKRFKDIPCHFLEIGSYEGRSAVWMLQNILTHPHSTLTCIDNNANNSIMKLYKNMEYFPNKVRIIQNTSTLALPSLIGQYLFEFIYIDGQHEGYVPLYDMVLAHELLHVNGIVAIDDYLAQNSVLYGRFDVRACFDAFWSVYSYCYQELLSNQAGYQKWLQKISC
jgi:predicted O-methyltransferase YrrM